jgi:translation initiation factor 3 subunit L
VNIRSDEEIQTLKANPDAWSIQAVSRILRRLIARQKTVASSDDSNVHRLIGYYAIVENIRMNCLTGDYSLALKLVSSHVNLWDSSELFNQVAASRVSLFYHTGVCMVMLRRYCDAMDVLSEIVSYIVRVLKPTQSTGVSSGPGQRTAAQSQNQKMLDKILSLITMCFILSPGHTLEDQTMECIVSKQYGEKLKRLQNGDASVFQDMLEGSCPKFIFAGIPDYSQPMNYGTDSFARQVNVFMNEVRQNLSLVRLRSHLKLYSTIEVGKLARFNDVSEDEIVSKIFACRHKSMQVQGSHGRGESSSRPTLASDVKYHLQDDALIVNYTSKKDVPLVIDNLFLSGIRKNLDCAIETNRIFREHGF